MSDPTPFPSLGLEAQIMSQHEQEWDHGRFVQGFAIRRIYRGPNTPAAPDPPPQTGDLWIRTSISNASIRSIHWWESGAWRELIAREHTHAHDHSNPYKGVWRRRTSSLSVTNTTSVIVGMTSSASPLAHNTDTSMFTAPFTYGGVTGGGIRVNEDGWYAVVAGLNWDTVDAGYRECSVWLDETQIGSKNSATVPGVETQQRVNVPAVFIAANQAVNVRAFQNSGANRNILSSNQTFLNIRRLDASV